MQCFSITCLLSNKTLLQSCSALLPSVEFPATMACVAPNGGGMASGNMPLCSNERGLKRPFFGRSNTWLTFNAPKTTATSS